jgi:LysM repeat protein
VNLLKPMLLMVVLGGIGYGVYTVLNKGPAPEPPPGIAKDWSKPLDISLGTPANQAAGAPPASPWNSGGSVPPPMNSTPPFNPQNSAGPPATPPNPAPPTSTLPSAPPTDPFAAKSLPASPAPDTTAPPSNPSPPPTSLGTSAGALPAVPTAGTGADMSGTASAAPAATGGKLEAVMATVRPMLDDGRLVEALRTLTRWYESPQLTADESQKLNDLLARLAGTVVYSRKHLLEPAYEVRAGDRLETIAEQYKVPARLLAKINGIDDPNRLVPGEKLKVLRGPFMALVEVDRRQVTLLVEDCYAGRFKLTAVGHDANGLTGDFEVKEKLIDPTNPTASEAAVNAIQLPQHHWVGFGEHMGMLGVSATAAENPRGLSLESRDAEDAYDILSVGSRIMVRR